MPLIIIYGFRGGGKTILATKLAITSRSPIYSNYWIDSVDYTPFKLQDTRDFHEKCMVMIDEANVMIDNRRSMDALNIYMSYILNQSRKRNITFIVTTQRLNAIDVRFREQADYIIKSENMGDDGHRYIVINPGNYQKKVFRMTRAEAKKWYGRYDTNQIIEKRGIEEDAVMISDDNERRAEIIMEYAQAIIEDYDADPILDAKGNQKKITKSVVDNFFFINGKDTNKGFMKAVYDQIKRLGK